ncbi:sorting nexin-14 isoform X1 [Acanthochromis polyacanthus]|uniref:sorting nexin-14 isoform X1 n=1 Tax=Acanthochromis polyacanthus TaxID=80966 RepID=UPI002234CCB2|nr:sorting nexin-14 isoform X1 [Acanthochromis polyacanthus]XP_051816971.1 sorting nexin-14 isoform X1 [Acanthochromis polyacanthus]
MAGIFTYLEDLKRGLKVDVLREAGRQYPLSCFLLLSMVFLTVLLNRYIHILMVFWSLLAGLITFYCSLGPESLLPNIFFTVKPRNKRQEQELFPLGHSCAVCGKVKCKRHRPTLLLENYQPWLDLKVHSKVDASIAEVFELVLENFVYPWYRDITDDEACLDEVRMTFRFFASVLVRRAQKVDITTVFADKVMKAAMKHIEIIAKAREKVNNVEGLQQAALDEYGADLHIALHSRKDELLYLRKLTEMLFSYVMPPKATDCRSLALLLREVMAGSVILPTLDFMADPDTVNLMVLIFVDDTPPEPATEPPSALVPFLQKYADVSNKKQSVLKLELKEIREQQDLLFRFMNFLKQEGAVHVLQFCLAVEEFNDKILSPELRDAELQRLHGEVLHIYETYCLDESIDKISFDPFIVEEIRNIAKGPYTGVVKLQTMRCLFEAYEHVLSLLERVFTPMFCHSDEYFRHLLRGAESPTRNSRINRNSFILEENRNLSKRGESFGISRIGSKIKGVFKSQTMEGAMLPPSAMNDMDDDVVEEATVVMEDDTPDEPASTPGSHRNLSAWSIEIPFIDFYNDLAKKEKIPVFCIDVERNDRKDVGHETEKWSVYRRYLEFYVLESKLTEFHGTFADAQLPSKRIIGPKNFEFLASKREEFEEYLQRLLQHPELSNSQLLADFLSPHSMESQFLDRMLPDVNLGKIFKSVPGKLIKERGQNLEPFIQSFFNSCESPKPKPSRPELTILSPTAENNKKLFNGLFKNNANLSGGPEIKQNSNYFMEMVTVDGMYDYMMYVGRVVFCMPEWLHHILAAGRILFKSTFEAYMDQYMQSKLEQILQEHRMVSLITQLRDAVFCENSEERTAEDKQVRAKQTFEEMMKYLPDFVGKCIGEEAKYEGIQLLFDGLQQPLLNKQMTYVLLDIAVQELFPELSKHGVRETIIV